MRYLAKIVASIAIALPIAAAAAPPAITLPAYVTLPPETIVPAMAGGNAKHYGWGEVELPTVKAIGAGGLQRGEVWHLGLKFQHFADKPKGKEIFDRIAAALTAHGWTVTDARDTSPYTALLHYAKNGSDSWIGLSIFSLDWIVFDLVEVKPQPLVFKLSTPAATPEKIVAAKGDFPYLASLPESKYRSGASFDGPLKLPTHSAAGNEIVLVGSGSIMKSYELAGLTTVQFAVVYRAALEGAGWTILDYSQNPHQGDAFISAHYGQNGRDLWAYLHGSEGAYSIAVADAGARDDLAATLGHDCHVALYGVLFDFNKASLKPESDAILTRVAKLLAAQPALKLEVQGHTDSVGSDDYNQKLSEARAASVVAWLGAHGVAAGRLTSKGYGETRPVASNDNDDGRAKNRRVEIANPLCAK